MKKILVIELDGLKDIVEVCAKNGWSPVFIQTAKYKNWLPIESIELESLEIFHVNELTFYDVIRFCRKNNIQAILPVSLLEPESYRDSLYCDFLQRINPKVNVVANSTSTIELTYDKWLCKQVLMDYGLPVVEGELIESNLHLESIAKRYGFPLIIKQRKGYTGNGVRIIRNELDLMNQIKKYKYTDHIAEPFKKGSEISLEIIAWKSKLITQPLVYKGETRVNIIEHPAYRPRVAPWKPGSEIEKQIIEVSKKAISILKLKGACEIEFIVNDFKPYILEINPRISGVSRICAAAGGVNSYKMLAEIATTNEINLVDERSYPSYAIQLPLTIPYDSIELKNLQSSNCIHYIKPINWMPLLPIKCNIIVSKATPLELINELSVFEKYTNSAYISEMKESISNAFKTKSYEIT